MGIDLTRIEDLKNFKEIINFLIQESYTAKMDNQHLKNNAINFQKSYGYYLVAKRVSKKNKQSDLDILFIAGEKKVKKIFARELENNQDIEEYCDRARCAIIEILYDIYTNKHKKYNITTFRDFKDLFATKESVNRLVATVLATLNNKYISQLRDGKTTNVVWTRVYNKNGTYKEVYTTVNLVAIDAPTGEENKTNILDLQFQNSNSNIDIEKYVTTLPLEQKMERTEGISKYLSSKMDLLTDKQRIFIKKYSGLGLGEESLKYILEHKDLKSIKKEMYSQMCKKKYRDNIQKNFLKKLKNDENLDIKLDSKGNLIYISKKFKEKENAIKTILKGKTNKEKLDILVNFLQKDNYTSSLLSDLIYSLPVKAYKPLVAYLNTKQITNKYIYVTFNQVIKLLEEHNGGKY